MKAIFGRIALAVIMAFAVRAQASSPKSLVRLTDKEYGQYKTEIRNRDLDFAGIDARKHSVYLLVDSDGRRALASMGLHLSEGRFAAQFSSAPDPRYKTPEQLAQLLEQMQREYPDLASVSSAGKSLEGRDMLVLKITQHVNVPSSKPSLLFNGNHHAREVMSVEVPIDIAQYLLSNYGKDAKVTHWLNSYVVYVMPMINPDGNNLVWTSDNWWRKNSRGGYGVDINRNYPYAWSSCNGSGSSQEDGDFHGASPASEPETVNVMGLVKAIQPVFDISFHSFSEIVIYPYGCGAHPETSSVVEPIGQAMAKLVPRDDGQGSYVAGIAPEIIYGVDGDDIDWMYHDEHVIPFVIEVNSSDQGFQPDYDQWRDKTVTKLRPAWQYLFERMGGPSIQGRVHDVTGLAPTQTVSIHVESASSRVQFAQDYRVHPDGAFNVILEPGDYKFTFLNGSQAEPRLIHVDQSPVKLDIAL